MSDENASQPQTDWTGPGPDNVKLVYVLYLLGFLLGGITVIVGVVFAYLNRGKAGEWVDTHYEYLIRTFWIGLLYGLISAVLMIVGIGFLLILLVAIWTVIRCVKGLQSISAEEPIANPRSWLI